MEEKLNKKKQESLQSMSSSGTFHKRKDTKKSIKKGFTEDIDKTSGKHYGAIDDKTSKRS